MATARGTPQTANDQSSEKLPVTNGSNTSLSAESKSSVTTDSSSTAKPIALQKLITSKPSFWLEKGMGTRQKPLVRGDHYAIFFTEEEIKAYKGRIAIHGAVRERWINKQYQEFIKKQSGQQIVILGSGFDIRAYKKNPTNQLNKKNADTYAKVKFWEIDRPNILTEKENVFSTKKLDKNATYIKCDYIQEDFIKHLKDAEIDFTAPTFIIWEGNTMYLTKKEISKTVDQLKENFKQFVIIFDYFNQSFLDRVAKKNPDTLLKSGIDDIEIFSKEIGLTLLKNVEVENLEKEYEVDKKPEMTSGFSICMMR